MNTDIAQRQNGPEKDIDDNAALEAALDSIREHESKRDFAAAASACRTAIQLCPDNASLILWLGWIYFNDKFYERASLCALTFIEKSPAQASDGHRLLAFSAAASGAWDKADQALRAFDANTEEPTSSIASEISISFLGLMHSRYTSNQFESIIELYETLPKAIKELNSPINYDMKLLAIQAYIEGNKYHTGISLIGNDGGSKEDMTTSLSEDPLTGVIFMTSLMPSRHEIQQKAVDSWLNTGAKVVSINVTDEAEKLRPIYPAVEFISVSRDASERFGKPYVYISDMMSSASKFDCDAVLLINSDIIIRAYDENYLKAIKAEVNSSLVFGHRYDVRSVSDINQRPIPGSSFLGGYDFFAFSPANAKFFIDQPFIFGCPWWDLWLPVLASAHRIELCLASGHIAFHETHEQRWNNETFEVLARELLSEIDVIRTHDKLGYSARRLVEISDCCIKSDLPAIRLAINLAGIMKSLIVKELRYLDM